MTSPPQFFRTLADRTRLRILNLLARGPLCVCDIHYVLGQPQSSISRHLGHLRAADLVQNRRDGMRTFYELTNWGTGLPRGVLEVLRQDLRGEPGYGRDLDRLDALKKAGECHVEGSDRPLTADTSPEKPRRRSTSTDGRAAGGAGHRAPPRSAARDAR